MEDGRKHSANTKEWRDLFAGQTYDLLRSGKEGRGREGNAGEDGRGGGWDPGRNNMTTKERALWKASHVTC